MAGRGQRSVEASDLTGAPAGGQGAHILIIEAPYYQAISEALAVGAIAELDAARATYERIVVPGALEIPQALMQAVKSGLIGSDDANARFDGCIALGCVIRGETSHYDIVCNNANHWLMQVAVANAILLITFAERSRLSGASAYDAAVEGASSRLRPILSSTCSGSSFTSTDP